MKVGWLLPFARGALAFALALSPADSVAAERAVVQGASALNIRRGPSTEHPAFGMLMEGEEVEVLGREGVWVHVRRRDGGEGYVRTEYLVAQEATEAREARAVPAEPPADAERPSPDEKHFAALNEENTRLNAELTSLREQLAAVQSAGTTQGGTTTQTATTTASEPLRSDLQRLIQLTEETHRVVMEQGNHRAGAQPVTPEPWLLSNGWILAVSALFGGFIGAAYGRLQERKRRTRIRF